MLPIMASDSPKGAAQVQDREALFRLDIKGDRQNLAYDSLHSASLPKYHHRSNAIGLDRGFRILGSSATRRQAVASSLDSGVRNRQPFRWNIECEKAVNLPAGQQEADIIHLQSDFVSVVDGGPHRRRRLSLGLDSDDSSDQDDGNVPVDRSSATIQDRVNDFQAEIHRRQRELRIRVSSQPNDAEAWHSLILLQADVVRAADDRHASLTASQQQTVTALRLGVYEDVLSGSKITDPTIRASLAASYLKEGSKVWDRSRQQREWMNALRQSSTFEFWLQYLNFSQTDHSGFSFDKCINIFQECLQSAKADSAMQIRDQNCLHLLLRLTVFLRQLGYNERAVAIWQAMLELNIYRPSSVTIGTELDALGDFWESEAARVGEPGALGWHSASFQATDSKEDPSSRPIAPSNLYSSWVESEKTSASRSNMPARTLDITNPEDPYRVVLFSDIKDFLVRLSSSESVSQLLDAVLCYCGLPTTSGSLTQYRWREDSFLYQLKSPETRSKDAECPTLVLPFTGISDSGTLFTRVEPFCAITSEARTSRLRSWAANCIEQIALLRAFDEDIGVYALALKLMTEATSVRKLAKRLLTQNPHSLKFYNALALIESANDRPEAAEKVWQTALTMPTEPSRTKSKDDRLLLAYSWAFDMFEKGNIAKLANFLASLTSDFSLQNQSTNTLDDTEHWLQLHLAHALCNVFGNVVVLTTDLLALTRYCKTNQDLSLTLETYHNTVDCLQSNTNEANKTLSELVHQHRATVIYTHSHILKAHFHPKPILHLLSESLTLFPHSSVSISLHDSYQRRYGLMDRLRNIASETSIPDTLLIKLQRVSSEMSRSPELGGTEHSVRSAFNKVLAEDESDNPCPELMLAYVKWEISLLDTQYIQRNDQIAESGDAKMTSKDKKFHYKQASRARDAVFSALRRCPWMKDAYLAAFESEAMRQVLGEDGLKELYESMLERGLRVRIEIDMT